MNILYITAQTPWSKGETFILEEMIEIKRQGVDLLIIPRNPSKKIFHGQAKELVDNALWVPLVTTKMIVFFFKSLLIRNSLWKILGFLIRYSRNPWIFIKNSVILLKGVYIANKILKVKISHIHAHWGSTTATMAYVISQLTGIPWSFTLHRWDIRENNMLAGKIKSAKFVRCISEDGKNKLLQIIGMEFKDKIKVIRMGVKIPSNISEISYKNKEYFKIITPANLLAVKGHRYLIEACSILVEEGMKNFECIFYGKGLMRSELKGLIKKKLLNNYIKMPGMIPREKLMGIYKSKKVDIVILPSVNTKNGEHEGIPVALMEAMAYSIPVISTNTGGIPELLSDKAGVIIEERNSQQLAVAIKKLIENENIRKKIGRQGYERVCKEFNTQKNTKKLVDIFKYYS
jgi:glycosyltransferase involved in cell wall biosynthesis